MEQLSHKQSEVNAVKLADIDTINSVNKVMPYNFQNKKSENSQSNAASKF